MDSAAVQWVFRSICKRDALEWVMLDNRVLSYTRDGGATWRPIPWRMTVPGHLKRILHRAAWPPPLDCFGWYRGEVAVAWHYQGEEDFMIGKYMAIFSARKLRWEFRFVGTLAHADDTLFTWYESLGFETYNRLRQLVPAV